MDLYDKKTYISALNALVDAEKIVIYCGAGVTLSRTGLLWSQLVLKVADYSKDIFLNHRVLTRAQLGELVSRLTLGGADNSPLKNASLISELLTVAEGKNAKFSAERKLQEAMTHALYLNDSMRYLNGPSETELLVYVCKMVTRFASSGKKVIIATTNYDTYLEEELEQELYKHNSDTSDSLRIRIFIGSNSESLNRAFDGDGEISLIYLHGRAPRRLDGDTSQFEEEMSSGKIVFSEQEYAEAASNTNLWLKACGEFADAFLILGSSMDDPPLLGWLQENRKERKTSGSSKSSNSSCKSVILVKALDTEDLQGPRVEEKRRKSIVSFDARRYQHLGVDYFLPIRIFSDIPIFLRDVLIAMMLDKSSRRIGVENVDELTFSGLAAWAKKASIKLEEEQILREIYRLLERQQSVMKDLFSRIFNNKLHKTIVVRLELWLRGIAPCEGNIYRVVRIADSSGVLLSPDMRRTEHLYRRFPSRTSAVRVMQMGRSQIESLSRFGEGVSASRWQGFYSVPLPLPLALGSNNQASSVIVGSIVVSLGIFEDGDFFVPKVEKIKFQEELDLLGEKLSGTWVADEDEDEGEVELLEEFRQIDLGLQSIGRACISVIIDGSRGADSRDSIDGNFWL